MHRANMKTSNLFLAVIVSSMTLAAAFPAQAGKAQSWSSVLEDVSGRGLLPGPVDQRGRMSLLQVASGLVPLGQVLESINAQEPGRQLDTNTVMENGRPIYVVRWQASRGRIIIFRVDAESGQIIGRQG